jgi:uncharacterized protein
VTENAQVQRTLFKRNLDEAHEYEVLVVGSGIGGGPREPTHDLLANEQRTYRAAA